MRLSAAFAVVLVVAAPAWAQSAPRPKAAPARADPVAASYAALSEAERISIQTDLIWSGDYTGIASAEFGGRAIAAVKAFQKRNRTKETGVLNPKERGLLAASARKKREAAGWRVVDDAASGTRMGIPGKLAPQHSAIVGGARWASSRGEVQVETFRIAAPDTTLQAVYEGQRKVAERKIAYNVQRPDFFVVSGLQSGVKKFYVRGNFKDGEVRGFTIQYDQALEITVDPIVIAMSSAFQAFPAGVVVAAPPRRKVEYGTGVFVTTVGHVLTTSHLSEACQVFQLAGHGPADLIAADKQAGLALLRLYGVRDLKPIALSDGAGAPEITLAGVADPQAQGGGANVSTAPARVTSAVGGQRGSIEPTPGPGFAGAAALDRGGKLVGIADITTHVVAGPPTTSAAQANLIAAETIKEFLGAQQVSTATSGASGLDAAKSGIVRVICVRK